MVHLFLFVLRDPRERERGMTRKGGRKRRHSLCD